jgi:hypothetical protein
VSTGKNNQDVSLRQTSKFQISRERESTCVQNIVGKIFFLTFWKNMKNLAVTLGQDSPPEALITLWFLPDEDCPGHPWTFPLGASSKFSTLTRNVSGHCLTSPGRQNCPHFRPTALVSEARRGILLSIAIPLNLLIYFCFLV